MFQEALESQRKLLGEERVQTLITKQGLGRLYLDQGEFDKAEPLLVEAVEGRRRVLGKEHSDTLTSMDDLAQLMVAQNKHVEAEALFRECLALREVKHPDRWMTFRTRSLLGTALLGQKKFAEAEPFIIDGCAGLKRRSDKIPYDERSTLPDSIQRAVDLYTEWERPVEAQKWQKRLPPPIQPAE